MSQLLCKHSSVSKNKRRLNYLAAFDFDYTLVDQNTDIVVRDLLPMKKLPKDLSCIVDTDGWTVYMAAVFRLLHQHKITPTQICEAVRGIPEVPGFTRLLNRLYRSNQFDLIIISDSNTMFIKEWLSAHGLVNCFTSILTNPAYFEDNGMLMVRPYDQQTDCKLSANNLCKGKVLEHFIMEQDIKNNRHYERIFYVGDGNNDICPVLRLKSADIACARQGFAMANTFLRNPEKKNKVRAELLIWICGFDLSEKFEEIIGKRIDK